jgi:hypothetical protein
MQRSSLISNLLIYQFRIPAGGRAKGWHDRALSAERWNGAMVRFTDIRQWTGTVADRGYVLAHGEIAASGASADLQANTELVLSSYLGDSALPATPDAGPPAPMPLPGVPRAPDRPRPALSPPPGGVAGAAVGAGSPAAGPGPDGAG